MGWRRVGKNDSLRAHEGNSAPRTAYSRPVRLVEFLGRPVGEDREAETGGDRIVFNLVYRVGAGLQLFFRGASDQRSQTRQATHNVTKAAPKKNRTLANAVVARPHTLPGSRQPPREYAQFSQGLLV